MRSYLNIRRAGALCVISLFALGRCFAGQSAQTNFSPNPAMPTTGTGMPAEVLASQTVGGVGAPPGAFGVTPSASPVAFNPYTGNVSRAVTDLSLPSIGDIGLTFTRYFHSRVTLDDRNGNALVGSQIFGSGGNWRHSFEWDFIIQAHDNSSPSNPTDIRIVYPDGTVCDFYNNSSLNTGSALPSGASLAPNISATLYRPVLGSADTDFIYLRTSGSSSQYILMRSNNQAYVFSPIPTSTPVTTPPQNPYYLSNIVDSQDDITNLTWGLVNSTFWEPLQVTAPNGGHIQLSYSIYAFANTKLPLLTKVEATESFAVVSASFTYTASTIASTKLQCESLTEVCYDHNIFNQNFTSTVSNVLNDYYSYALPTTGPPGSAIYPEMIAAQDLYAHGPNQVYFTYSTNDIYQCGTVNGIYDYIAAQPGYKAYPPLSVVPPSPNILQWEGSDQHPLSALQAGVIYYSSANQANTNEYLYTVDGQGQITQVIDNPSSLNLTCSNSYSTNSTTGNVTTVATDATPQHNQTTAVRSQTGRLLSITYPPTGTESVGPIEQWTYTTPDANNYTYLQTHINCPTAANSEQGNITKYAYQAPSSSSLPLPQLVNSITYAYGTSLATSETYTYGTFSSYYSGAVVVTQHKRRNGHTEVLAYNQTSGFLQSVTDGANDVTSYTYGLIGYPATMVNGNLTTFSYNYANLHASSPEFGSYIQTSVTNLQSSTPSSKEVFNEFGQVVQTSDLLGNLTTYTYDDVGRVNSVTGPAGTGGALTVTYAYNFPNNYSSPDSTVYSSGITTTLSNEMLWGYRPLSVNTTNSSKPDPSTAYMGYDNMGNMTSITDPLTNVTRIKYDGRNRETEVTDPLSNNNYFYYDDNSCLTSQTSPSAVVNNTFDVMNRLSECVVSGVSGSTYQSTTHYSYDLEDELQYYYGPDSNFSNSNTAYYYQYDGDERLISMKYPDSSSESYTYDGVGNVLNFTARDGRVKTAAYSWFNAPNTIQWTLPGGSPDPNTPSITCSYDGDNRLSAISNANATIKYSYDNYSRPLSETQSFPSWPKASALGPVSYNYTPGDDSLATLKYPDNTLLTYGYKGRDELQSITQSTGTLVTYGYNTSNCISKTLGNGVATAYGYDSLERLNSVVDTVGMSTLQSFNYGYDNSSRISYVQHANGLGDVYGYDASDQLTQVQYNANSPAGNPSDWTRQVNYSFDPAGNRSLVADGSYANGALTSTTTSTYTLSSNQSDQYSSVAVTTGTNTTSTSIGYNTGATTLNLGFLGSYGAWSYTYDAYGHLTKAVNSSTAAEADYEYDPLGRCVASYAPPASGTGSGTTTYYVYGQGWNVLEEFIASGKFPTNLTSSSLTESQRYILGGSIDEIISRTSNPTGNASTVYYNYDGSGNVTMLTPSSGTVSALEKYIYDIYGAPTITSGSGTTLTSSAYSNRYLFSGREYDSTTGLYHYRNRDYSPQLGRFLQPDPAGHAGDGYNLYRFCSNDPVNYSDPFGLDPSNTQPPATKCDPIIVNPPTALQLMGGGDAPGGEGPSVPAGNGSPQIYNSKTGSTASSGPSSPNVQPVNESSRAQHYQHYGPDDSTPNPPPAADPSTTGNNGFDFSSPDLSPASVHTFGVAAQGTEGMEQIAGALANAPDLAAVGVGIAGRMAAARLAGSLAANSARGLAFEAAVRAALQVSKNTSLVTVKGLGSSVPDIIDASGNVTEIKDVVSISFTKQLQIQARAAKGSFNLIVSPRTQYISGPLQDAVRESGGTIQIFNPANGVFTKW